MRFFIKNILVGILCTLPLFAFAQTATSTATTTAEQPNQAVNDLQQKTDQLVQDRMNQIPTVADIRTNALRDYLDVKTVPQNPGPAETVQVTVQSYLTDLNKAAIRWSVDGKTIEQGIGKTTFSFKNGPSGKTTRLTISIIANTGERVTKELSWSPVGLIILWEADTYTPPFYRGKALLSPQATVKVVAVPENAGMNALGAGGLVYLWEKEGDVVPEASGYGKNSFSFAGPKPYDESNVKVRASSINDAIKSEARIRLPLSNPFILFYENNPLLGVSYNLPFNTTLSLTKKEVSVSAEPYFFSNERSDTPTLKYDWSINGKPAQNYGRTITLRNDAGTEGESLVSLAIHGLKQTFQLANQEFRVHFGASESTSRPAF